MTGLLQRKTLHAVLAITITVVALAAYTIISESKAKTAKPVDIMALMALADQRKDSGYKGAAIWNNNISITVAGLAVADLNDFPELFKKQNVTLDTKSIAYMHNIIGYVAENASQYKNRKIDLFKIHKMNEAITGGCRNCGDPAHADR